jgi:8-oxo-dGTP pyrophosphatase MutT (NUDIX family)
MFLSFTDPVFLFVVLCVVSAAILYYIKNGNSFVKGSAEKGVTWKTYDWSKHDSKFYQTVDTSHGLIIFSPTGRVLMVQNKEGNWGFPKGHEDDFDGDGFTAARREVKEETGISVPKNVKVLDKSGKIDLEYISNPLTEEKINNHIREQIKRKERPNWNKPEPKGLRRKIVFYVVMMEETPGKPLDDGLKDVQWFDVQKAGKMIIESNSNQLSVYQKAVVVLNEHS